MRKKTFAMVVSAAFGLASSALAAEGGGSAIELPEVCKAAATADKQMMTDMQHGATEAMKDMSGHMTETQKDLSQAMTRMDSAMMRGMTARDADLAFACSMLSHHQGAVDMARVELARGDNPEAKAIARKTIDEQEKSIGELRSWLQKDGRAEERH